MGPLSYLHSGLPKISGVWILPYCIGDRGVTENAEWDTLQLLPPNAQIANSGIQNFGVPS